jgi:PIN domain nuclease of toxin-antitoxin system
VKLLLDTHAFIWWDQAPDRLSGRALRAISRSSSEVFLSVVSLWEMAVKSAAGKLELNASVRASVEAQQERNALRLLPVEAAHVWALDDLPGMRGDPFDRMLAAQAVHEGMVLVTRDARLRELKVRTLW